MNSFRNPLATWLGPLPGSNFDNNRVDTDGTEHSMQWVSAADPSYVVIHTEVGHTAAATSRFENPASEVSATYGVTMTGGIVQWVDEKDAPYATGNWEYNLNSIDIEHEDGSTNGVYAAGYTDAEYEASGKLVKDICTRYGIPITRQWIIKHKEVPGSSTSCPDALDIDRIVAIANGAAAPVVQPAHADVAVPAGVPGVVYDAADNDRSYLDYKTATYVTGQIAAVGTNVVWDRAKLAADPARPGEMKWLDGVKGSTWALWDNCVDDGGFDPPHFSAAPTPIPVPVDDDSQYAPLTALQALESRVGALESKLARAKDVL